MAEEKKYGLKPYEDDYNECVLDPNNDRRKVICDSENASDSIIQCIGSIETQYIPDSERKETEKTHGTGTVIHIDNQNNIYILTAAHNICITERECNSCKTKTIKRRCPKCSSSSGKTGHLVKPTHIYFTRRGNGAMYELGKTVKTYQAHQYKVHEQYHKFPTARGGYDIAVMIVKCKDENSIKLYKENCKKITLVNDRTFGANKSILHIFGYPGDSRKKINHSTYYYLFGMGTSKLDDADNQFQVTKNHDSNKLYIVNKGIDTTVGQSGSCIYSYNGDDTSRYLLYGVHTGGSMSKKANFGTVLDRDNMEWVAKILVHSNVHKYMICHHSMFGVPNVKHKKVTAGGTCNAIVVKKITKKSENSVKKKKKKYAVKKDAAKNVWSGYIQKFGKEPMSANQLHSYSKMSDVETLTFKQARQLFDAKKNSPQNSVSGVVDSWKPYVQAATRLGYTKVTIIARANYQTLGTTDPKKDIARLWKHGDTEINENQELLDNWISKNSFCFYGQKFQIIFRKPNNKENCAIVCKGQGKKLCLAKQFRKIWFVVLMEKNMNATIALSSITEDIWKVLEEANV